MSYATGNAVGTSSVGGLSAAAREIVSNSYATGNATGTSTVGGFMGSSTGTVTNAYSTGFVTGTAPGSNGGLLGTNTGVVN